MAAKPKLHYFDGRGRMESTRWLLAAAGVEFEEKFIETAEDLDKLRNDGSLMFQQVPMVEIDGLKLVQTRAILNYIASKYNLYGKDIKERALIDMYSEGVADLGEMVLVLPLTPPGEKEAKIALIKERTVDRYFPAFEKVSAVRAVLWATQTPSGSQRPEAGRVWCIILQSNKPHLISRLTFILKKKHPKTP
ncbi:glutathione S-transferase A1 isoform X4 [Echinops telfairi]|uniref:Glutathione S-transferase A1 isoform X4 n=1 Tax=Echinops telfairi TaxID=9371 RepID=A0AC55DG81_ECHTE|nr:glutathione S-transferase A1 isoform X4 [Echinops telfairi]